jgi:hypothetical protein
LNLVVIGDLGDIISSFARSLYRCRPVSPMRAFGRVQDISAKKISRSVAPKSLVIHGWLAPLRFRNKPVLILQVSSPRGGRFGPVDGPDGDVDLRVDDARDAVIQELLYSQSVSKLGSSAARAALAEVSRPMASARSSSSMRSRFRSHTSISSIGSASETPAFIDPNAANKQGCDDIVSK